MNIFVTDSDPDTSAKNLDDKRVIKMVLESAQMLSTAIIFHKYPEYFVDNSEQNRIKRRSASVLLGVYKPTHINHPSNVWARNTRSNWQWLFEHFEALCLEYKARYSKTHKCSQIGDLLAQNADFIPKGSITEFANCAAHKGLGISYKHLEDVELAYKLYLNDRWGTDKRIPTWYGETR